MTLTDEQIEYMEANPDKSMTADILREWLAQWQEIGCLTKKTEAARNAFQVRVYRYKKNARLKHALLRESDPYGQIVYDDGESGVQQ